jgi:hypothetical protein
MTSTKIETKATLEELIDSCYQETLAQGATWSRQEYSATAADIDWICGQLGRRPSSDEWDECGLIVDGEGASDPCDEIAQTEREMQEIRDAAISGLPLTADDIVTQTKPGVLTHLYDWTDEEDGRVIDTVSRLAAVEAQRLADETGRSVEVCSPDGYDMLDAREPR